MRILAEVSELEGRVVDTVRSLQRPVVDCVRKGVGLAEGKLPKVPYPESLPPPADLVRARFDFARALLDAQRDFVSGIVQAVTPLVTTPRRDDDAAAAPGDAGAGGAGAGAAGEAESAEPAPKTAAEPAAPRTTATKARARKAAPGKTAPPPSTTEADD